MATGVGAAPMPRVTGLFRFVSHSDFGSKSRWIWGAELTANEGFGGTVEPTIFAPCFRTGSSTHLVEGGIAQLARALAWHARGPGFESPYLHNKTGRCAPRAPFFFYGSVVQWIE